MTDTYRGSILVVDDMEANLHLLAELLEQQGYAVRPVLNGKLAISSAKTEPPDLILLDVMLPGISGYEVCQTLKADERTRDVPILFISVLDNAADIVKAFSAGGVDFITKPFRPQEVLARVKTHITLRHLNKQLQDKNAELEQEVAEHRETETKLREAYDELNATLDTLQKTQEYVSETEKMVMLGQVVAGVIHELNTPIAVIHSSLEHIAESVERTVQELPAFLELLPEERQHDFWALLKTCLHSELSLHPHNKRRLRKTMMAELEQHQIPDARKIANTLIELGIQEHITTWLPLLQDPNQPRVLEMAHIMAGLHKSTSTLQTAAEQAMKFVSSLKTYSRHAPSEQPVLADVTKGIDIALMLYNHHIKQGVDVIKNYQDIPALLCYPDELNQVWSNLIQNALQAMENTGVLTIDVEHRDHQIHVAITNTGPEIPEELQHHIFEPFFTTKTAEVGSGLGLNIVKKILTKHQGQIACDSRPGQTTFYVSLPCRAAE